MAMEAMALAAAAAGPVVEEAAVGGVGVEEVEEAVVVGVGGAVVVGMGGGAAVGEAVVGEAAAEAVAVDNKSCPLDNGLTGFHHDNHVCVCSFLKLKASYAADCWWVFRGFLGLYELLFVCFCLFLFFLGVFRCFSFLALYSTSPL